MFKSLKRQLVEFKAGAKKATWRKNQTLFNKAFVFLATKNFGLLAASLYNNVVATGTRNDTYELIMNGLLLSIDPMSKSIRRI